MGFENGADEARSASLKMAGTKELFLNLPCGSIGYVKRAVKWKDRCRHGGAGNETLLSSFTQ